MDAWDEEDVVEVSWQESMQVLVRWSPDQEGLMLLGGAEERWDELKMKVKEPERRECQVTRGTTDGGLEDLKRVAPQPLVQRGWEGRGALGGASERLGALGSWEVRWFAQSSLTLWAPGAGWRAGLHRMVRVYIAWLRRPH